MTRFRSRSWGTSVLTLPILWITTCGLIGQAQAPAGGAAASAKPVLAGEFFRNVRTSTLRELTVDDFLGAMGVMSAGLGFDCSNCHPGAGFETVNWTVDSMPTKVMARKMIDMVATINRNNFAGAQMVTCWTCHHGRDVPTTEIALDHLYSDPFDENDTVITRNPNGIAPEQILDKYLAALGGSQQLSKLTSFIATGTQSGYASVKGGGVVRILAKAPDQRAVHITFPQEPERGEETRAYDGRVGWVNTPRSVIGEYQVTGTELDGQRLEAELAFPGQIKQVLTGLRTGTDDNLDGHIVHVVQGNGPRGLLVTLYFDKDSGLLRRLIRYGKSPVGRISTQVDYDDYRSVNGIKFPFKVLFSWLDGRNGFLISDVKTNVAVDAAEFGRPRRATITGKTVGPR
jgi:hypothetical protein